MRLLEDEVAQRCGARHERRDGRALYGHGRQAGFVTLAGQKLPVAKPRMRRADGSGEVELENYALLQRDDALPEWRLRRMVRDVSTRDYEQIVDVAVDGFGVKKSSVSRGLVKASAAEIATLAQRRLDDRRYVAIFIDGKQYAGETMIVVRGGGSDRGEKRILGLRQGATENAQVVTSLLEDRVARGFDASRPTLFVLDGAVSAVSLNANGQLALTGDAAGTVRLWDVASGEAIRKFEVSPARIWSIAFSADGRRLLAGFGDGEAVALDANTGEELSRFRSEGLQRPIASVGQAFLADIARLEADSRLWSQAWHELQTTREKFRRAEEADAAPRARNEAAAQLNRTR